jgi:hypothetical protein
LNWLRNQFMTGDASMRSITKIVDGFKQNWTRELSEDAIAQAARDAGMT